MVVCPSPILLTATHQARKQHINHFESLVRPAGVGFKPPTSQTQSRHSKHYTTEPHGLRENHNAKNKENLTLPLMPVEEVVTSAQHTVFTYDGVGIRELS